MKPVLSVVDDHPDQLETIRRELTKRYGDDYEIDCCDSPTPGLRRLQALRKAGAEVVALLAARTMTEMIGLSYLRRGHEIFPLAERVLMLPTANRSELRPVLEAVSLGRLDSYVPMPRSSPDERFNAVIAGVLQRWQRPRAPASLMTVVGERLDPRAYRIRDLLERGGLPFTFLERSSEEGMAVLYGWIV